MDGQISIFEILFNLEEGEDITPAQEYYMVTGKRTYWQDSQGKPYRWFKGEKERCRKR